MLSWLGFEDESGNQKKHMIEALNARSIAYTYLNTDDLSKAVEQVLQIPTEDYDRPSNYKHLLMRPLDFQVLAVSVQTKRGKEVTTKLVKLGFVVNCYRQYEMEVKEQRHLQENQVLQDKNEALQQEKQHLEGENTSLLKCKADLTTDP